MFYVADILFQRFGLKTLQCSINLRSLFVQPFNLVVILNFGKIGIGLIKELTIKKDFTKICKQ